MRKAIVTWILAILAMFALDSCRLKIKAGRVFKEPKESYRQKKTKNLDSDIKIKE